MKIMQLSTSSICVRKDLDSIVKQEIKFPFIFFYEFFSILSLVSNIIEKQIKFFQIDCLNGGQSILTDFGSEISISGSSCRFSQPHIIDVYIPHTKFPIYVNVTDPRSKMGDTFTRIQHLNKVVMHTKYAIQILLHTQKLDTIASYIC